MPQERLTKIWEMLAGGSRVLGWSHGVREGRQTLTPLNGRNSWERSAPDDRWAEVRGI